jgi:hypothetical protein
VAKQHSSEFIGEMARFYKAHKDANLEQARKRAKQLGYGAFSRSAHDRYRNEACGKTQRTEPPKAPARKGETPDRVWMDVSTGRFYEDPSSGKPGMKVAVYDRVAEGTISLAYPQNRKRSRKQS